jgi:hypothetical protein
MADSRTQSNVSIKDEDTYEVVIAEVPHVWMTITSP